MKRWFFAGLSLLGACAGGADEVVETADTGEPPNQEPLTVCINELMPDNHGALAASEGVYVDWIELHNPTDQPVDLTGWGLSDDSGDRFKHTLGPLELPAGGFTLLFASGDVSLGEAHVGFSLAADGELVVLTHPDNRFVLLNFPALVPDYAWARTTDCCVGDGCFAAVPIGTPGVSNVAPEPAP